MTKASFTQLLNTLSSAYTGQQSPLRPQLQKLFLCAFLLGSREMLPLEASEVKSSHS